MFTIFLQAVNKNLLLGLIPEPIGLLIFGSGLIAFAVGLRWLLNRRKTDKSKGFSVNIHTTVSET